jgi:hypothetical protein
MAAEIPPDDRELIEHARKINKTLSLFVLALQECVEIPVDGQLTIADTVDALAEAIRARANSEAESLRSDHLLIGTRGNESNMGGC